MAAKKMRVRLLGELWERDAKGVRTVHKPGSVVSVSADLAERLITNKSAEPYTDPSATIAEVGEGSDEASPQAALAARVADKSKPAPATPAPQPESVKDDAKAGTTGQG